MTGVKDQNTSASLMKKEGMLGRLEYDEGETRNLYLGTDCMTMSKTAYKFILGGSVPLPFK